MAETISLKDKIIELRSKILIHSYMYWYKDNPLVSDTLFLNREKEVMFIYELIVVYFLICDNGQIYDT